MDWITQNKLIKWLIGILLVVNILTITIIWILISRDRPPMFDRNAKPQAGIDLLQKELGLTEVQKKQFEDARKENFAQSDDLFKELNEVKTKYFGELQNEKTDTVLVNSLLRRISAIQIELEKLRYDHFRYLLSVCTKEQKEKFKPLLKEILVGKPPREIDKGNPGPELHGKDGIREMPPPPPPDGNMNMYR
ncbi:MAG: periplasmic heavy metal sensor [Ignavibacteriales bacterium]|nr:periplasmic heavy metal sensor [Ignavibacteriales bacterium]